MVDKLPYVCWEETQDIPESHLIVDRLILEVCGQRARTSSDDSRCDRQFDALKQSFSILDISINLFFGDGRFVP